MKCNENSIEMLGSAEYVAGQSWILTSDLRDKCAEKQIAKLYNDAKNHWLSVAYKPLNLIIIAWGKFTGKSGYKIKQAKKEYNTDGLRATLA